MRFALTILLHSFVTVTQLAFAQPVRQAENWHFGSGISISFVGDTPVFNPPSAMATLEGACSLSDTLGTLLFYTNGGGRLPGNGGSGGVDQDYGSIWNRNHEVMYDMRGVEGGGFSAQQSAVAMPAPGNNPDLYYLFTMEETEFAVDGNIPGQPAGRGLSYFTIDMSLNGGLGGVVLADQRVLVPAYEGLAATPMDDGDGYWIACHNNVTGPEGELYIIPLTATGIGTPVTVSLANGVGGRIKFSPDGSMLYQRGAVYAFDNATGMPGAEVARFVSLSDNNATFTPDSRFLYGSQPVGPLSNVIVRYDLVTLELLPVEPLQLPGEEGVLLVNGSFQIGPNGNIYFLEQTLSDDNTVSAGLSEISCVSGAVPSISRNIIDLSAFSDVSSFGNNLPQYVDAIFQQPFIADTVVLDTVEVLLCPQDNDLLSSRVTGVEYNWSTGDTTETIMVLASGAYCVTVSDGCTTTIDCREVSIQDDSFDPEVIGIVFEDCQYLCQVDLNLGYSFDSIRVLVGFTIPNGQVAPFFTGTFSDDLLTFPKLPELGGNQAPYISAFVLSECGQQLIDLLDLPYEDPPAFSATISSFEGETPCVGQELELTVRSNTNDPVEAVIWEDGNTDNPRLVTAALDTVYSATVISFCGDTTSASASPMVAEFCDCEDRIPEVFTPNSDGVNDGFRMFSNCPPLDFTMLIYNRWGQVIFKTDDPEASWDGAKNGTPQNMDVYLYRIVFRYPENPELQEREGTFSLIR